MIRIFVILLFILAEGIAFSAVVGVLTSKNRDTFEEIQLQFTQKMREEGHEVKTILVQGKMTIEEVKSRLKIANATCLFTIGRVATELGRQVDMVGVFTMILRPVQLGLLEADGTPKGKMTGVLITPDLQRELEVVNEFFNVGKAGVVFNPSNCKFIADSLGVSSSEQTGQGILRIPISSKEDILPSFERTKSEVDAFFSIPDLSVYNNYTFKNIIRFTIINRIPFVGFNPRMVKMGALIGYYCDYPALGTQAGELLVHLLKEEKEVLSRPAQYPEKLKYSINMKTAKILKVAFPPSFQKKADRVFN